MEPVWGSGDVGNAKRSNWDVTDVAAANLFCHQAELLVSRDHRQASFYGKSMAACYGFSGVLRYGIEKLARTGL